MFILTWNAQLNLTITSLWLPWWRSRGWLHSAPARSLGSIPGWGTKTPQGRSYQSWVAPSAQQGVKLHRPGQPQAFAGGRGWCRSCRGRGLQQGSKACMAVTSRHPVTPLQPLGGVIQSHGSLPSLPSPSAFLSLPSPSLQHSVFLQWKCFLRMPFFCYCCLLLSPWIMPHSLRPHGLQRTRLSCPPPSPGVCSDSSLSRRCHSTISSSVALFSFCPSPHLPLLISFLHFCDIVTWYNLVVRRHDNKYQEL